MRVEAPEVKKIVDDYDLVFSSGMMLPVTLDKSAGDTIEFDKDVITFRLTAKPSINDPDITLPAEDITVFTKHLVTVQHRTREVRELTPEQQFEWKKHLKEVGGTIQ
jgi:hypothetical protein